MTDQHPAPPLAARTALRPTDETARLPPGLSPERLRARCDPAQFEAETSASLPDPAEPFGQARAVDAVQRALAIPAPGFNLFVLGEAGSARHAIVQRLLEQHAATRPAPQDWCYIENFEDADRPRVLHLPAGEGTRLQAAMNRFVSELGKAIMAALESDEYRSRIEAIQNDFKQREERALGELGDSAATQGVALLRTPAGFAFAPTKDGKPLAAGEFDRLPAPERERLAGVVKALRERLDQITHQLPRLRREMQQCVREATRDAMGLAAGHLIEELKEQFAPLPDVLTFLDETLADVIDTGAQLSEQTDEEEEEGTSLLGSSVPVGRYRVNLLVGHASGERAPVVWLDNPTQPNLVGRVEHVAHMGTLLTNFTLIKPGALHRANGGYLMLDALKVLAQPNAWESLKWALRAGQVRIESLAQSMGWAGTASLEPEPVPLSLKVVLFGERLHYYLLQELDPEFNELFKVAADFEDAVPRDAHGVQQLAAHLGALARREGLRALERGALARLVEYASRMAGDAMKLSTHLRELDDVLREADQEARLDTSPLVRSEHVVQAIAARVRRADRVRDELREAVQRETLLIATEGMHVAQVNGLAVHELGEFCFGHPVRITATARMGDGDLVDIERESTLGRPIHSKGVMILAAYLGARYAQHMPLSLSASLVFEQSYGPIEGDSASLAELCALLSALAAAPIRQSLAVTGSVNQHGAVQAVGAINEKIEGFFEICRARGLDGRHAVLIPQANLAHLMLDDAVVDAVAQGRFHVYAVAHVDQALELLTGVPAGDPHGRGELLDGSVNPRVAARLAQMTRMRHAFATARATRAGLRGARRLPEVLDARPPPWLRRRP